MAPAAAGRQPARRANRLFLVAGLFVAFVLAAFVSGFASSSPDGLEKVAEDKGFLEQGRDHAFSDWPIADYAVSGIGNERLAGGLAGVIGVTITFAVGGALVFAVTRLRRRRHPART
ncbi:MAG: PDGLE domain-containing protein [Frankia sp.]|nr:PDGLE domain-containing protein [Frankia sp.]